MNANHFKHLKSIWLVHDGKAGDRQQLLAVAQALCVATGAEILTSEKLLVPRLVYRLLAPRGPVDPKHDPARPSGLLSAPHPDLVIGTGRRIVPAMRAFKRLEAQRPLTVFLKDPRTGQQTADLIWVPAHDRLTGPNVLRTDTGPVRTGSAALEALRHENPDAFAPFAGKRLAVVLGGPSGGTDYDNADCTALGALFADAMQDFDSALITASRRTPSPLSGAIRQQAQRLGKPFLYYGGEGENPYPAMLAHADAVLVTGDSHNMVSEAVAGTLPVAVFRPGKLNPKLERFLDAPAVKERLTRPQALLAEKVVAPLNSTPIFARAILEALETHRRASPHD